MPFEKVETQQVDFPAQERGVLEFWQRTRAFEKLRTKNRGKPRWSFLDGPITANNPMGVHHAWGRTYKDAYQRYFAMTGRELRYQNGFDCQGLWVEVEVEKELKLQSKRDIENLVPGDTFASIDRFVQQCKERVDKFARVQTEQSIRLGYWMDWDRDGGLGRSRPASGAAISRCRRRTTTRSGASSRSATIAAWFIAATTPCRGVRAAAVGTQPDGDGTRAINSSPIGPCSCASRCATGRSENLLVWTTTPWTLTQQRRRRRQSEADVPEGAAQGRRSTTSPRARSRPSGSKSSSRRKEWVEGVPKLKTLEQIFKEKGGYEIVGEVPGARHGRLAVRRPVRRIAGAAASRRLSRAKSPSVVREQNWAPEKSARDASSRHRLEGRRRDRRHRHRPHRAGLRQGRLPSRQGTGPAAVAPLDEYGVFVPGFGELDGQVRRRSRHDRLDPRQPAEKGVLLAVEKYPHSYPHCWRCKTELLFRLVDEWFIDMNVARRDHERRRTGDVPARVDQRQGPRAGLAQEHGRLDDLQETLLGSGPADLGR